MNMTLIYTAGRWQVDLRRRELRADGIPVPIGLRAFEIIEMLVRSSGELVTKDDLMGELWPGAIVGEATLWVHISAIRKALGADRAMLRTVSRRGYRLMGNWSVAREAASADDSRHESADMPAQQHSSNIPEAGHDLIGRAAALQKLLDISSAYRAITLTGPGGIGKTVLALEVARRLLPSFEGNCWLVDLSALFDPNLVASAVAAIVGLRLNGDAISSEDIARAIGRRKFLLVFDNCEHIIEAASSLIETIVRFCPQASILSTSRETLQIQGEQVFHVPPLEVPSDGDDDAKSVLGYSAVQLFVARMRALHPDFAPSDVHLCLIGSICERLDGVPLAIEFAVACAAALGLEEVVARLDDRFGLLTAGQRTAPPRQRTLAATLEWSYQLLPEQERRLLRHLSVFRGGFTIGAAIAVAGDGAANAADVVTGIRSLVAKSLVATEGSPVSRWRLLETTREYAGQELRSHGEVGEALRKHARYFADLVLPIGSGASPMRVSSAILQHSREIDNVRAALEWAFSPIGDTATGVALTATYAPVWLHLSLLPEARKRAEQALANLGAGLKARQSIAMKLNLALGLALIFTMGRVASIRPAITFALRAARNLGDAETELQALWALWILDTGVGETRTGESIAEDFRRLAFRSGDQAVIAFSNRLMGYTQHLAGKQKDAQRHFRKVVDATIVPVDQQYTTLNFDHRAVSRAGLAMTLMLRGFVDQAVEESHASLNDALATGYLVSTCEVLRLATFPIAVMIGDFAAAEKALALLMDVATRQNGTYWIILGNFLKGELEVKRGDLTSGVASLQTAFDLCDTNGWASRYPEFLTVLAEGMTGLGRTSEALSTIDRALARADRGGELLYLPETVRTKGELILRRGGLAPETAAGDCFTSAAELARKQGALFWELRATISGAWLKAKLGHKETARRDLSLVYDRFTEGFSSADLCTARAMLDELSVEGRIANEA